MPENILGQEAESPAVHLVGGRLQAGGELELARKCLLWLWLK